MAWTRTQRTYFPGSNLRREGQLQAPTGSANNPRPGEGCVKTLLRDRILRHTRHRGEGRAGGRRIRLARLVEQQLVVGGGQLEAPQVPQEQERLAPRVLLGFEQPIANLTDGLLVDSALLVDD